jgi:hypothetical protein
LVLEPLNYPEIVKKHGVTLLKQTRATNMTFAGDINVLARSRDSALSLLDVFQKALDWTRCLKAEPSFGAIGYGKFNGVFQVFDPLLKFGDTNVVIPFLDKAKHDTFRLLGCQFSVDLKVDSIRNFVIQLTKTISQIISNQVFYKKLYPTSGGICVHSLPPSWLKEHIIPEYTRYCKKWFGGARCQNTDLYFSPSGFGFNVPDILSLFHECQLQQ